MKFDKIFVIFIILIVLTTFQFSFAKTLDKQVNKSINTIFVDDDKPADFTNIQDAIDAANAGDTIFIKNGTYFENIIIDKSINLIGENKYNTVIDGGIKPRLFKRYSITIFVETDHVNILNLTVQNATGIDGRGIYFIKNNGIEILKNNTIKNTIIKDCSYGLIIVNPLNNTVLNNSFYNCCGGYFYPRLTYHKNIYENNTVNDKEILSLINKENLKIEGDYGVITLTDCRNITINNFTTSNITVGIDISFSEKITVKNCTITNTNRGGIYVHHSKNCKFIKNHFENDNWGIFLRKSNNNQILNNNFLNITKYDWFSSSYNNKWCGNFWEKSMNRPKLIYGKIGFFEKIPWINIDRDPATCLN